MSCRGYVYPVVKFVKNVLCLFTFTEMHGQRNIKIYFRCSILSSCKHIVVYFVPQKSVFCAAVPLSTPTGFEKIIINNI